jgi:hypothetical protein
LPRFFISLISELFQYSARTGSYRLPFEPRTSRIWSSKIGASKPYHELTQQMGRAIGEDIHAAVSRIVAARCHGGERHGCAEHNFFLHTARGTMAPRRLGNTKLRLKLKQLELVLTLEKRVGSRSGSQGRSPRVPSSHLVTVTADLHCGFAPGREC